MKKLTPIFHGKVSADGERLDFDERERHIRRTHLRGLAGKRVDITVKPHREQRSVDQNSWLWGVAYPLLAETCGYEDNEHEQLHYSILGIRFGTRVDPLTSREVPRRTSSQLSTGEFSDYMEWLVRWAASDPAIAVTIPLPNEAERV